MLARLLILVLLVFAGFGKSPALAASRVALVIGNAEYGSGASLNNPINDARDISAALKQHGFEVTRELNLTLSGMKEALRTFRAKADEAEIALVYYAGHGIEVAGQNYLLPTDSRLVDVRDVAVETLRLDRVTSAIRGASALAMVVLDACRDNPFRSAMAGGRSLNRGLVRPESSPANSIIVYAADEGQITPDGLPGGNSPFTEAFLEALKGPAQDVSLMLRSVKRGVRDRIGPHANPAVYDRFAGDRLVLNSGSAAPMVIVPPAPKVPQIGVNSRLASPVMPGARIAVGFKQAAGLGRNEGVDFDVPAGSPVFAADDGEVALISASLGGLGTIVLVRHPGEMLTVYGRVDGVVVKKGQRVARGQKIGVVAETTFPSEPRLHFEVRRGADPLDPMDFL